MKEKRTIWDNTFFSVGMLTLCAVAWGSGYLFNKIGMEEAGLSPEALLFSRLFIATICIAAIFPKRIKSEYEKGDWKAGALAAAFFVAATLFQTYGLSNTSPGVAAFLTTTYVVIVPIIWWIIRKEKPSRTIAICSILAIIGIGFLSLTDGLKIHPGDLLVLICAFGFSGYIISISVFARDMDEIVFAFLLFLFCTIYSFALFVVNGGGWAQFASKEAVVSILYLALVYTFISNTVQVFAQAHIRAGLAAILLAMESLFGAMFGIIGGYDVLTTRFVIGGILMILAVMLPALEDYRNEKKELKKLEVKQK